MKNKTRRDLDKLFMKYLTPPGSYLTILPHNRTFWLECVIACRFNQDKVYHMFDVPGEDDTMEDEYTGTYRLLKEYLDREYMKIL
jgi:hypothetical protein